MLAVGRWLAFSSQKQVCSCLLTLIPSRQLVACRTPSQLHPFVGWEMVPLLFHVVDRGMIKRVLRHGPRSQGNPGGERGPGVNLPVTPPVPARVFIGPQRPPQMSAVNLNDVFADFYRFSAYDSFVLVGLFSVLRSVVLGQSPIHGTSAVFSSAIDSSCISQFNRAASQTCTLQEIHDNVLSAGDQVTQEQRGDSNLQPPHVRPDDYPRRRRKAVVPIDTSLLRRSVRLEQLNQGFNPNATISTPVSSSAPPGKGKGNKGKGKAPLILDGSAYEGHSVPGAPPSPHLSAATVQAIGVGFYKM
jgi:hypothetical protein